MAEIRAVRYYKPARVTAEAWALVSVKGVAAYDEVLAVGLAALGETKSSLFGYGVTVARPGEPGVRDHVKPGGTIVGSESVGTPVRVYVHRD